MAKASGIKAGRAYVELFADDSRLVRGLRRAQQRLKAFGDSVQQIGRRMMFIGAAATAALLATTKVFADVGDELQKMSLRTGIDVESLSALAYAADLSGTSLKEVEVAIRRMQRSIYDAGRGLSTATDALSDLGLTAADLQGMRPEDQFQLISDRLAAIADPTRKAAIAMALFGRSGTQLLPMLNNLRELRAEAERRGLVISKEDADAAAAFKDAMSRVGHGVKMMAFRIGVALAPTLIKISEVIKNVVDESSRWIKENQRLVIVVAAVAAAVTAAGVGLIAVGLAAKAAAFGIGVLIGTLKIVGVLLVGVKVAIGLLLSPIGLVVAAVAGLGAAILHWTGAGKKALDWLKKAFRNFAGDARQSIGSITERLLAGDISTAARLMWVTLKLEWQKGVQLLSAIWDNFCNSFVGAFDRASTAVAKLMLQIMPGLDADIRSSAIKGLESEAESRRRQRDTAAQAGVAESQKEIDRLRKELLKLLKGVRGGGGENVNEAARAAMEKALAGGVRTTRNAAAMGTFSAARSQGTLGIGGTRAIEKMGKSLDSIDGSLEQIIDMLSGGDAGIVVGP